VVNDAIFNGLNTELELLAALEVPFDNSAPFGNTYSIVLIRQWLNNHWFFQLWWSY
jgi:hypothetical protein